MCVDEDCAERCGRTRAGWRCCGRNYFSQGFIDQLRKVSSGRRGWRIELLKGIDQMRRRFRITLFSHIGDHRLEGVNGLTNDFDGANTGRLVRCFAAQQCVL